MTIRPYRPADRDRLRQICRETAAKPFQKTGRTLEAVTLIYNDYFTAYEPDHIFVLADESDRAVGYILCAADYRGFVHCYRTTYLRRVLRTAPDQAAGLLGYLWCLGKIKNRPVHFHLDILPPYQRQGWGTRLMDTLCRHLRERGVDYLSCCGVSRNSAGYKCIANTALQRVTITAITPYLCPCGCKRNCKVDKCLSFWRTLSLLHK